jgi:hypothetical protein
MSVKKKIEKKEHSLDAIKYINEGAQVLQDANLTLEWKSISLRIPSDLLCEVDFFVKKRVGMSRNAWILEALLNKCLNESKD